MQDNKQNANGRESTEAQTNNKPAEGDQNNNRATGTGHTGGTGFQNRDNRNRRSFSPRPFSGKRNDKRDFRKRGDRGRDGYELFNKILYTRRVSKTTSGGRNVTFHAIAVAGDKQMKVGIGSARATIITQAIRKAVNKAKQNTIVPGKINSKILYKFCATKIIISPRRNTISHCANYVSEIFEMAGIHNVSCKILSAPNKINVIGAVFQALKYNIALNTNRKALLNTQNL